MSLSEQLNKLKENWLLLLLAIIVIGTMMYLPSISNSGYSNNYAMSDSLSYGGGYSPVTSEMYKNYSNQTIAPNVQTRKIVKTSNLGIETKLGKFQEADLRLREVVKTSSSFILNENIYSTKINSKDVFTGSYTIKVENNKLESVTSQLKILGKVTGYTQGADDVTGEYTNVAIELKVEKDRLERYIEMYADAETMADKIELNDRIFNQERTIKYLEDSVKNIDERIDYSTIYLTINERSDYLGIAFVKLSDLARSFMSSLNSLVKLIVVILPWVLIAGFVYAIARITKKSEIKKKR